MRQDGVAHVCEDECWALLRTASVGRLALSVRALPAILPVQYYVGESEIAVCLGFFDVPASAVTNTVVAFAADSIAPVRRCGWTVQVQGTGRLDQALADVVDCDDSVRGRIVHLTPVIITGYRAQLCPFAAALPA